MCCSGGSVNFPDPQEIGQAQADYNRIDQYTPFGSVSYHGPNRNIAVQQLSPESLALQEALLGLRMGALGQLMNRYGASPFELSNPEIPQDDVPYINDPHPGPFYQDPFGDYQGDGENWWHHPAWGFANPKPHNISVDRGTDRTDLLSGVVTNSREEVPTDGYIPGTEMPASHWPWNDIGTPDMANDPNAYLGVDIPYDLGMENIDLQDQRSRYEQAYMDRARGLLDPMFLERESTLNEQLANRGLPVGTEEAETLFGRLGRERTDTYARTALDAVLNAGQEARADRGQTLAERLAQFQTAMGTRGQLFNESNVGFNQLASILGLTPVSGAGGDLGQFYGPGSVDMIGAYGLGNQGMMFNANRQLSPVDIFSGLMGLGGAALGGI